MKPHCALALLILLLLAGSASAQIDRNKQPLRQRISIRRNFLMEPEYRFRFPVRIPIRRSVINGPVTVNLYPTNHVEHRPVIISRSFRGRRRSSFAPIHILGI